MSSFDETESDPHIEKIHIMSEDKKALINVEIKGESISKVGNNLINKISSAIGAFWRPRQIRRIAEAESEAAILKAETDIQIRALYNRTEKRFIEEEMRKQENIESITAKAIPLLEDGCDPSNMDDDWIMNFFDKCRIVSDEAMQALWAKIIAGEANSPGSFSKRTVNILNSLDKGDAGLFERVCRFCWEIQGFKPLVLDYEASIYTEHGINSDELFHLDAIGLIKFNAIAITTLDKLTRGTIYSASYFGESFCVEAPTDKQHALEVGYVNFTRAGLELSRVTGSQPVPGFVDYALDQWKRAGFILGARTQ